MNMSIVLQIATPHYNPACTIKGTKIDVPMGTVSESSSVNTSVNCANVAQLTTYPNCCGLPYQDHNYGAPPPPTPPQSPAKLNGNLDEDTSTSIVTTSTTNEDDALEEESITRCICEFDHDDEYMICCDKCSVWQHVDCMGLDRNNIPETYMCEKCEPRKIDKQKAKALQTRKKEEMTPDSSTEESGDENADVKSGGGIGSLTPSAGKGKKMKRRRREKTEEKLPATPTKRVRRRMKEKLEPRRTQTRKRRKSKSLEVTHIDEDALDSWDSTMKEWMDNYEHAETNQYSPEVHLQLSNLKLNGQHEELARKVSEHPRVQLCHVADVSKTTKGLLASSDIRNGQIVCECRGKFLLVSQFQQQNSLPDRSHHQHPFVLFYSFQKGYEDVCVDCRQYGNDARFVRRSCTPNAEVHHIVESGSLHLYIVSIKEIQQDEEITIAFDYDPRDELECACMKVNCSLVNHVKRNGLIDRTLERRAKRMKKNQSISVDDEGDHHHQLASGTATSSGKGCKTSPLRLSQSSVQINCDHPNDEETLDAESECAQSNLGNQTNEEMETQEQASERRKKMTREERKMEAIMKAFARMEKTQQRRQEALARLALKKEEQETKKKDDDRKDSPPSTMSTTTTTTSRVAVAGLTEVTDDSPTSSTTVGNVEALSGDESKISIKPRKGKKRKNSGNPMRRRSRMSSGGSDILSPDESAPNLLPPPPQTPPSLTGAANLVSMSMGVSVSASVSMELASVSAISVNNGFKFPKTKKAMMTEWLSESTDVPSPVQPLTIKTEPNDFTTASPTCYMRSARSPTGINLAHLRRVSGGSTSMSHVTRQTSDCSMGSAKKRWLRQAMCEEVESVDQPSPIANGSLSPTQTANSPSTTPPMLPDLVTPLKKRRLPRESMSSDTVPSTPPSTPSSSVGGQADSSLGMAMASLDDDEMQCAPSTDDYPSGLKDPTSEDANLYDEYFKNSASTTKMTTSTTTTTTTTADLSSKSSSSPTSSSAEVVPEIGPSSDVIETMEFVARYAADMSTAAFARRDHEEMVEDDEEEEEEEEFISVVEDNKCALMVVTSSETRNNNTNNNVNNNNNINNSSWSDCSAVADSSKSVVDDDNEVEEEEEEREQQQQVDEPCQVTPVECSSTEEEQQRVVDNPTTTSSSSPSKMEAEEMVAVDCLMDGGEWSGTRNETTMTADSSSTRERVDVLTTNETLVTTSAVVDACVTSGESASASVGEVTCTNAKPDSSASNVTIERCDESETTMVSVPMLPVIPPPTPLSSTVVDTATNSCSSSDSEASVISSSTNAITETEVSTTQMNSPTNVGSGVSQSCSSASTSPSAAATRASQTAKRKVSLLEYRKRKMENQSTSSKSTTPSSSSSSSTCSSSGAAAVSSTSLANLSPTELSSASPPRLSTLPLFEAGASSSGESSKNRKRSEEDTKWNGNPTTLEQQRENLTQRLRREFGLITDDDADDDKESDAGGGGENGNNPVATQNGRPIGCYPSHPQTPLVRTSVPIVRNIPTIIGITGYQPPPPPRVLHPASQMMPGSQQYAYQQYAGLYAVPTQGQAVTQFAAAGTARPTLALRPPIGPLPPVPRAMVLPASRIQPPAMLRPARPPPPPILPTFHDPQAYGTSSRQQPRYGSQGYYQ